MTEWQHEIQIKDMLRETTELLDIGAAEGEVIHRLGLAVAEVLETLPPNLTKAFADLVRRFRKVRNRTICNELLAELYEVADTNKVWLGL